MMYPYMTLNDGTEIATSEILEDGRVKVCIEKPDATFGLKSMLCCLPGYEVEKNYKFTDAEVEEYLKLIRKNAHVIMDLAKEGL